jgi:hypothetical protein
MAKRDREGKGHMHEYDDNWQCRCGFRLVTEPDSNSAIVKIKAFVTPEGQTVALREGEGNRTEDQAEDQTEVETEIETEIETEDQEEASTKPTGKKKH